MHHQAAATEDARSTRSSNSSLDLDEEDRRYLEALRDRDHVATRVSRHPLGLFSVVAFILQQMIGTGIFRTPWTVMQATESTGISLLFWFLGALTAVAGAALYIEFGLAIPRHLIDGKIEPVVRNGGDLNYVGYMLKRPKFLVLCLYGLNYIFFASSAANALSFGDDAIGEKNTDRGAGKDAAARGLAMIVVTLACLLHAFTRRGGIILNNIIVVAKVAILCIFPIMAICVLAGVADTDHAAENLKPANAFADPSNSVSAYVQGILAILFAYNGYNQANYVLCEIHRPRKTFVKGIIIAVSIVCVLYMLINVSFMIVVSKQQQLATHDIGLQFLTNIIGSKKAPRVLAFFTSINSLGNIIGMTFAASRVKQEVAKEGVIPFAKFFGENRTLLHPRKSHDEHALDSDAEPTPLGALFLHWMFAMILIIATWPAKPSNAYQILVNLYTYVTDVIPNTIMGVGIICLRLFTNWSEKSPLPRWISYSSAIIFTLTNGFPLVAVWVPPAKDSFEIPGFPWYMTGALSWAMVTFSILYWFAFRYVWPRIGSRKGKEFVVEREPVFRVVNGERVLWHEIVLHSWVVKDEPERRNTYALDDI